MKNVVDLILGLRSDWSQSAVEFARDVGSALSIATDGRRAFLVWADTLGKAFHSVDSTGGPSTAI